MIGRVAGRLVHRAGDHVMIDVGGIGYVVHVSERTLAAMPGAGEAVALYTDLLVREDLLQLFGFTTLAEKEWHRLLMTVQGIGAKASMAILGTLGADGVSRAIALGDWAAVKAAPGVGPKIAQRVVNELKDKAPAVMALAGEIAGAGSGADPGSDPGADPGPEAVAAASPGATSAPMAPAAPAASAQAEALSALVNLGYGPGEAAAAVAFAAGEGAGSTEDIIRAALKHLAPKG